MQRVKWLVATTGLLACNASPGEAGWVVTIIIIEDQGGASYHHHYHSFCHDHHYNDNSHDSQFMANISPQYLIVFFKPPLNLIGFPNGFAGLVRYCGFWHWFVVLSPPQCAVRQIIKTFGYLSIENGVLCVNLFVEHILELLFQKVQFRCSVTHIFWHFCTPSK